MIVRVILARYDEKDKGQINYGMLSNVNERNILQRNGMKRCYREMIRKETEEGGTTV